MNNISIKRVLLLVMFVLAVYWCINIAGANGKFAGLLIGVAELVFGAVYASVTKKRENC